MGGVAGHMDHLYDNPDLTFREMKEIMTQQKEIMSSIKTLEPMMKTAQEMLKTMEGMGVNLGGMAWDVKIDIFKNGNLEDKYYTEFVDTGDEVEIGGLKYFVLYSSILSSSFYLLCISLMLLHGNVLFHISQFCKL